METLVDLLSTPGVWAIIGLLILISVVKNLTAKKPKRRGNRKRKPSSYHKPRPKSGASANPDRYFTAEQKKQGHARAGNQCEYTHTKSRERCPNKSREGDHFYPYSKGGATTLENFVSACEWHNQKKSGDIWERERPLIEARREKYFRRGKPVTIGDWREDGYRLTLRVGQNESVIEAVTSKELVARFQAMRHPALDSAAKLKVRRLSNPGQVCDFIWNTTGYFLVGLDGKNSSNGKWMSLRLQAA
jgi:hypothetical protein